MEIWNFIRQQPFQWTISGGAVVTIIAISVTLCVLGVFRRKRPELTPSSTRVVQANGRCRSIIGLENTGKSKAFDTRIVVLVWSRSKKCTPFIVHDSNGNPISPSVSEQIEFYLPKEPVFIAVSFTYRSRPNSKRKGHRASFYYKWNGVDSALVHASIEECRLIERVRVGFTRLEKQAEIRCSYLTASANPALSPPSQRAAA
jgi:hypothetical protein